MRAVESPRLRSSKNPDPALLEALSGCQDPAGCVTIAVRESNLKIRHSLQAHGVRLTPRDQTRRRVRSFAGHITDNGEGIQCYWNPTSSTGVISPHVLTGGLIYYPRSLVRLPDGFPKELPASAQLSGVVVVDDPNAPAGTPTGMGPGSVSGHGIQPI
jgi:hypothetical protein